MTRDRETLDALLQSAADSGLQTAAVELIATAREASELLSALEDLYAKRTELRNRVSSTCSIAQTASDFPHKKAR